MSKRHPNKPPSPRDKVNHTASQNLYKQAFQHMKVPETRQLLSKVHEKRNHPPPRKQLPREPSFDPSPTGSAGSEFQNPTQQMFEPTDITRNRKSPGRQIPNQQSEQTAASPHQANQQRSQEVGEHHQQQEQQRINHSGQQRGHSRGHARDHSEGSSKRNTGRHHKRHRR